MKDSPMSLQEAMEVVQHFSDDELCEIYENVNSYKWDNRLGEKPVGFDSLDMYNRKHIDKITKRKTKSDYVQAAVTAIGLLVPQKKLHHHGMVVKLGWSEERFESWWRDKGLFEMIAHISATNFVIRKYWPEMFRW